MSKIRRKSTRLGNNAEPNAWYTKKNRQEAESVRYVKQPDLRRRTVQYRVIWNHTLCYAHLPTSRWVEMMKTWKRSGEVQRGTTIVDDETHRIVILTYWQSRVFWLDRAAIDPSSTTQCHKQAHSERIRHIPKGSGTSQKLKRHIPAGGGVVSLTHLPHNPLNPSNFTLFPTCFLPPH